jgi:hypothetical protein
MDEVVPVALPTLDIVFMAPMLAMGFTPPILAIGFTLPPLEAMVIGLEDAVGGRNLFDHKQNICIPVVHFTN